MTFSVIGAVFFFSPCVGDGLMIFLASALIAGSAAACDARTGTLVVTALTAGAGAGFTFATAALGFGLTCVTGLAARLPGGFFGLVTTFYSSFLNGINNIYNLFVVANNIARHRQSMTIH
ncbi:hypothetical protein ACFQAT_10055 [Undibacterium arcticum]|uniref:Uncharacterized protein n=1 Tax=Undibacterium arcticum TaxID=1762892 RepID=A0ABV7F1Z6_9BURK